MHKMIAYCGLVCTECPSFIVTKENDEKMITEQKDKQVKTSIKPEESKCQGCIPSNETTYSHPGGCEIRKCGQEKEIINCAHCDEYACDNLNALFKSAPSVKVVLDNIRKTL